MSAFNGSSARVALADQKWQFEREDGAPSSVYWNWRQLALEDCLSMPLTDEAGGTRKEPPRNGKIPHALRDALRNGLGRFLNGQARLREARAEG